MNNAWDTNEKIFFSSIFKYLYNYYIEIYIERCIITLCSINVNNILINSI